MNRLVAIQERFKGPLAPLDATGTRPEGPETLLGQRRRKAGGVGREDDDDIGRATNVAHPQPELGGDVRYAIDDGLGQIGPEVDGGHADPAVPTAQSPTARGGGRLLDKR